MKLGVLPDQKIGEEGVCAREKHAECVILFLILGVLDYG